MAASKFLAASIVAQPVTIEAAGFSFTVPAQNADAWILAISDDEPVSAVFPGLLTQDGFDRATDLIAEDLISLADMRRAAFRVISLASGRKWWEAMRLVGMCDGDGEAMGMLTLKGVDPCHMPFGRWCAAVYALALSGQDDKERMKFTTKLMAPPPIEEAMDDFVEGDSFDSMVKMARAMPGMRVG